MKQRQLYICFHQNIPTKYPQGRGNAPLYGPPYAINIGFPPSSTKLNTRGKIALTKTLLDNFNSNEIHTSDFFLEHLSFLYLC